MGKQIKINIFFGKLCEGKMKTNITLNLLCE